MRNTFSLAHRNYYPWLFVGLVVATNVTAFLLLPIKLAPEFVLSITAAVAAFVHFLYSQHNHNTAQFINLFRDFNAQYNELNGRLNVLIVRDNCTMLTLEEKQLLFDYFNLCAEEYLYFKSGYIDVEVWQSWLTGMKYFASNTEVRRLWSEELESGSYYEFSLSLIDAAPNTID